ncbi:hypothetical protein PoB_006394500 [Plakobranchus ocellatus]|uniref:Uncharacterized protein n=1 Tax=Plakobranchus ocellatus TaxID=259542 RepID=A0AAV4D070_9GAST|nr:hypothetical protein PoB_006394500 [Plakobranchus ocellatus]
MIANVPEKVPKENNHDDRKISQMEEQLNTLNAKSKEIGLEIHEKKTKYNPVNYVGNITIKIEYEVIENMQSCEYLGKKHTLEMLGKKKCRWSFFGRIK